MDVFGTGPRIEDAITVYIRQFRGIGKGSRALAMHNDYARATVRARRRGAVAAAGPDATTFGCETNSSAAYYLKTEILISTLSHVTCKDGRVYID